MGKVHSWFVLFFMLPLMTGCIAEQEVVDTLELVVESDVENGTLVQVFNDGEKVSESTVVIEFDFSKSTSANELLTFGIDPSDGSVPITVDARNESRIEIEFFNHGVYNMTVFAIDDSGVEKNSYVSVRIELRIEWTESNTNEPQVLTFDPQPMNDGPSPTMIEVYSTIENPNLIEYLSGGNEPVQITWNIIDELDDVCQRKSTQIQDGESEYWNTIHFNTFQVHDLKITVDDSQERISVSQSVTILY